LAVKKFWEYIMDMTQNQKSARAALVMNLLMRGQQPTNSEILAITDTPFAEWPEELKAKVGPLSRLVQAEDEKAAAPSQEK